MDCGSRRESPAPLKTGGMFRTIQKKAGQEARPTGCHAAQRVFITSEVPQGQFGLLTCAARCGAERRYFSGISK
jgi:hypothetical protein